MSAAQLARRADVHRGPFAHRFHAAEHFDGVGCVIAVRDLAVLALCVDVFRFDVLSVGKFRIQFFGGNSAPWRKPVERKAGSAPPGSPSDLNSLKFLLVSHHLSWVYFSTNQPRSEAGTGGVNRGFCSR